MSSELNLCFPDPNHVQVTLLQDNRRQTVPAQAFTPPLNQQIRNELSWYLETYPIHYTTELDDARAAVTAGSLKEWGSALFSSVFADDAARRLFNRFQDNAITGRVLTVSSLHPTVLAQPWELLADPGSTFLFLESPHITICRTLPDSGRLPYQPAPKDRLHLLFVVSRPADARSSQVSKGNRLGDEH
jgi:hypothetical protein